MPVSGMTVAVSFWDDPILKLQEWSQSFVTFFEDWLSSFSVGDWVLVAFALAALFWIVASLRAMTRLGPIEVETLEHDGENKAAVKALTAALREQLARNGLNPPPSVPAGTPQVNLIAAVEASGVPQSAFIAKLLELLPKPPRPPQYNISGVLIGEESNEQSGGDRRAARLRKAAGQPSDPPEGGSCGLSYWVRPSREGRAQLDSVNRRPTHRQAVDAAAAEIYLHVSNDAIHAFPIWARWHKESSIKAYVEGCRLRREGSLERAVTQLTKAIKQERFNALGRLQLANLYEACVPPEPGIDRASAQSLALRSYLDIASEWPVLVEARYRASVIAGALATTCDDLRPEDKENIRRQLSFPNVTAQDLSAKLRDLASRESKAVLQLLKPWYALFRDFRLRNQFEPKARERRELKHTVSISKHCMRMRELSGKNTRSSRAEIRYRGAAVHVGHLFFGRGSINWLAHYNAACFDALLLGHLRKLRERQ